MMTIHHICGHETKVDKVIVSPIIPKGYIVVNADKPCPNCQFISDSKI